MQHQTGIFWFRQDLRLSDNSALQMALTQCATVILVYILDSNTRPLGGASRWWLHHSLQSLATDIAARGGTLNVYQGDATLIIKQLVTQHQATAVFWNRCYEPDAITRDKTLKADLSAGNIHVHSTNSALLLEPWQNLKADQTPYTVFTPFWKNLKHQAIATPVSPVSHFPHSPFLATASGIAALRLRPEIPDWAGGLCTTWQVGEQAAWHRLEHFLSNALEGYPDDRNRPDVQGTSRLSPHLHFGEISPRQIWHFLSPQRSGVTVDKFLSEVAWREFSYHLLYHFPTLPATNWRKNFDHFPWQPDAPLLKRWQQGKTGYPIVDAGMRELWYTGWMHNRVRMITASFLTKHLLQPWQDGEAWFWDTLVDADMASNAASWQWVAGCGADAAPYFRIFNPVLQGQKFDPHGDYVRRWLPELADISLTCVHSPWLQGGVAHYPAPMVDHDMARKRALSAFDSIKQSLFSKAAGENKV